MCDSIHEFGKCCGECYRPKSKHELNNEQEQEIEEDEDGNNS
jgi:hypothetical protein